MSRRLTWTLGAAFAVAGMSLAPLGAVAQDPAPEKAADSQANPPAGDKAGAQASAPSFPAGIKAREFDADDQDDATKGIRDSLNAITEAAFTKGGFDDVVERLVDADRNRIGNFAEKDFPDLNGKIDQLVGLWKQKYGQDKFEVDEDKAYGMLHVQRGEVEDAKAVAGNWPVPSLSGGAQQAASSEPGGDSKAGLDSNIENGREVAIVTFPASHGLPALSVSMIMEAGGWRIDVPNTVDGQKLHDNLVKHMDHAAQAQNEWPADVTEAQLAATHHVLAAVYGVDMESSK